MKKVDDYTLKFIAVLALVGIAIGTAYSALWLAQILDVLRTISNK